MTDNGDQRNISFGWPMGRWPNPEWANRIKNPPIRMLGNYITPQRILQAFL